MVFGWYKCFRGSTSYSESVLQVLLIMEKCIYGQRIFTSSNNVEKGQFDCRKSGLSWHEGVLVYWEVLSEGRTFAINNHFLIKYFELQTQRMEIPVTHHREHTKHRTHVLLLFATVGTHNIFITERKISFGNFRVCFSSHTFSRNFSLSSQPKHNQTEHLV